jgi:hypothetical protein
VFNKRTSQWLNAIGHWCYVEMRRQSIRTDNRVHLSKGVLQKKDLHEDPFPKQSGCFHEVVVMRPLRQVAPKQWEDHSAAKPNFIDFIFRIVFQDKVDDGPKANKLSMKAILFSFQVHGNGVGSPNPSSNPMPQQRASITISTAKRRVSSTASWQPAVLKRIIG